jgi:hypothetical protein
MGKAASKVTKDASAQDLTLPPNADEPMPGPNALDAPQEHSPREVTDTNTAKESDLPPDDSLDVEDDADDPSLGATRAHIEQTRIEMSETIDAIKEKLTPQHLAEEAKDAVRTAARTKIQQVKKSVEPAFRIAGAIVCTGLNRAREELKDPRAAARKMAGAVADTAQQRPALVMAIAGGVLLLLLRSRRKHAYRE